VVCRYVESLDTPKSAIEALRHLENMVSKFIRGLQEMDASQTQLEQPIVQIPYRGAFGCHHLTTRRMPSHIGNRQDTQRFSEESFVNPHPRTHNILANEADNQRQMADLSDYNVAHNSQNNPKSPRKLICFISGSGAL
jgi:hypothetical protein